MKYPQFLNKKENAISLIAPSFGCTTEPYASRLKMAIKHFTDLGFKITEGPNIYHTIGFRSNTNLLCAKEFTDAYLSDSSLLLSVGGGNLMNEILDDSLYNIYNAYLKLYDLSFEKLKEIRKVYLKQGKRE